MLGAIYARYSAGPNQTDQSIEGQVADCQAYAERNGIQIVEIYADRHISGKSIVGRNEFQRMLHDAEQHRFECVIVWKIDRFGRDRQDIALSKMKLKRRASVCCMLRSLSRRARRGSSWRAFWKAWPSITPQTSGRRSSEA